MDICNGGTISAGSSSITFTNDHAEACTITSCTIAGWPATDPVIPAKQGSTPGSKTVQLSVAAAVGSYTYVASCCSKRNNPVIKVQ
jgi:hypothetical protein